MQAISDRLAYISMHLMWFLYDKSLEGRNNLSCGANEEEYHFKGLDMGRDVKDAEYHDFN